MGNFRNRGYRRSEKIILGVAALAVLFMAARVYAFVRYSPVATISAGDITSAMILDGTIVDADLSGSAEFTIASLGVGTSSPYGLLAVSASSTEPALTVKQSTQSNSGPLAVFYSTTTEVARITNTGLFGIGIASPTHILDVSVGLNTAFAARIKRTSAADNLTDELLILETAGLGDASIHLKLTGDTGYMLGVDNSDGNKFKIESTNIGAGTNFVTLTTSGLWGIATTSPASTLSAHGSGYISNNLFVGGVLTATSSALLATQTGDVGVATTSPAVSGLSVHGGGYVSSNLFVGGTLTSTSSAASTFPYASTTALTVSGTASTTNLTVSGACTGCVSVYATTSATVTSASGAGENAQATAYCLSGDIAVSGGFTLSSETNAFNIVQNVRSGSAAWVAEAETVAVHDVAITTTAYCLNITP